MKLKESSSTVHIPQEDSFITANLIIHSTRAGSRSQAIGGSKEAGLRGTNTFQGSRHSNTHTKNDRHAPPWSLAHPPVQSRTMSLLILHFWPLTIKSTMMTGFQHNSLFPVTIEMDVPALEKQSSSDFSCQDRRENFFLMVCWNIYIYF